MSAVGIISRGSEVLLVRREKRENDPWSGDIAFPGGHVKSGESAEQGVLREIREEVNLDLKSSNIIYGMKPLTSMRMPEMPVYPFVLRVTSFEDVSPGQEIDDIKIVEVQEKRDTVHTQTGMPAYDYGGWIVWGLTYRILNEYLKKGEKLGKLY